MKNTKANLQMFGVIKLKKHIFLYNLWIDSKK